MTTDSDTETTPVIPQVINPKIEKVSIIVSKGEVLSIGTNQYKTHPIAKAIGYRYSEMHSELNALLKTEVARI